MDVINCAVRKSSKREVDLFTDIFIGEIMRGLCIFGGNEFACDFLL